MSHKNRDLKKVVFEQVTALAVMREGFIGVHIGAGQHSELRTKLYLEICAQACAVGVEMLKSGGSAVDAACAATMVLEDAGETNAGYGSNLTESGTVEMGKTIMVKKYSIM